MSITLNGTTGITSPAVNTSAGTVNFDSLSTQNNSISGVNGVAFRNRIINGAMTIDQRNSGASGTAIAYTVDRWSYTATQASKGTWQQNAGAVAPPAGFTTYLGFTSSSAYSVAAGDYFVFRQPVEANNMADLGWGGSSSQAATLSFWVRSSLTGTFGGCLDNGTDRGYSFTYTINFANTWEQKTVQVPAPAAGGTWGTGNGIGVYVTFGLGVGSTYSGTANTWNTGRFLGATGAVSVVSTNGATFYITGVQLEAGSVATPFERRPYGTELALCQRYYDVVSVNTRGYSNGASGTIETPCNWHQIMRAAPTVVLMAGGRGNVSSASILSQTTNGARHSIVSTAAGDTYELMALVTASAEL